MGNLDEYESGSNIINCFSMKEENPLFQEYLKAPKREVETKQEQIYEWKCFLLKKYLSGQVYFSLLFSATGLLVFILTVIKLDDLKNLLLGVFLYVYL